MNVVRVLPSKSIPLNRQLPEHTHGSNKSISIIILGLPDKLARDTIKSMTRPPKGKGRSGAPRIILYCAFFTYCFSFHPQTAAVSHDGPPINLTIVVYWTRESSIPESHRQTHNHSSLFKHSSRINFLACNRCALIRAIISHRKRKKQSRNRGNKSKQAERSSVIICWYPTNKQFCLPSNRSLSSHLLLSGFRILSCSSAALPRWPHFVGLFSL